MKGSLWGGQKPDQYSNIFKGPPPCERSALGGERKLGLAHRISIFQQFQKKTRRSRMPDESMFSTARPRGQGSIKSKHRSSKIYFNFETKRKGRMMRL